MNFTVGIIAAVGILVAISLVMIAIDPGYLSGIPVKPVAEKPVACTLDYVPVCGIDGITYGNLCMLNATKVKLDHLGECITEKPVTTEPTPIVPQITTPLAPMNQTVSIPQGVSIQGCEIKKECYLPNSLEIRVHDTVIWHNDDAAAHTVSSGNPTNGVDGLFDSGLFMAGNTFAHTFDDAGTYSYFCMVHPWMTGQIIVKEIHDMMINGTDTVGKPSLSADNNTSSENVKTMVSNAIALYDKNGTDSFKSFNSSPDFHLGDLYVFVFQYSDSMMVAHGANQGLIGTPVNQIVDVNGDSVGKMVHEKATAEGAWVEYMWENPVDHKVYPKKSWVVIHDGYVFGSGSYDNTRPIEPTGNTTTSVSMPQNTTTSVATPQNTTTSVATPQNTTASTTETVTTPAPESQVEEKRAAPVEVTIAKGAGSPGCETTKECYLPDQAKIYSGEPVVWVNADVAAHTVTSGSPGSTDTLFDSGMIMPDQKWEFVFTNPGEYPYYCMVHPWMTGKVIVS